MVQPYPITVSWKNYEKRFKVDSRNCGDTLLQTIKKEFWIPKDMQVIGLSNLDGELLTGSDLNPETLKQAGSKFMLLLSGTNSASKIPPELSSVDQGRQADVDSQVGRAEGSPVFQAIKNLDNFFGTTLNGIKPNTRLLMIKVKDSSELEKFVNEGVNEQISKLEFKSRGLLLYPKRRKERERALHFKRVLLLYPRAVQEGEQVSN